MPDPALQIPFLILAVPTDPAPAPVHPHPGPRAGRQLHPCWDWDYTPPSALSPSSAQSPGDHPHDCGREDGEQTLGPLLLCHITGKQPAPRSRRGITVPQPHPLRRSCYRTRAQGPGAAVLSLPCVPHRHTLSHSPLRQEQWLSPENSPQGLRPKAPCTPHPPSLSEGEHLGLVIYH